MFDIAEWINNVPELKDDIIYVDKERKNQLNGLNNEYFEVIKSNSLCHFTKIEDFLKNPQNKIYNEKYLNTVSDLRAYIVKNQANFITFMDILEHIIEIIVGYNDDVMRSRRALVRIFVHFMYYSCDIGKVK